MDHRAFYYDDEQAILPEDDLIPSYDDEDESSLDFYDAENAAHQQQHHHFSSIDAFNDFDLTATCIRPTLSDALFEFLLPILLANLVSRLLTALIESLFEGVLANLDSRQPRLFSFILLNLSNAVNIAAGGCLLLYHYRFDSGPLLLFISLALLSASFTVPALLHTLSSSRAGSNNHHLLLLWALSILLISLNEAAIFLLGQDAFIKLRPNMMLLVMKSISYYAEEAAQLQLLKGKDKTAGRRGQQNFAGTYLHFAAYLLHPSVLILGVWHPHSSEGDLKRQTVPTPPPGPGESGLWLSSVPNGLLRALLAFSFCLLCLLISSCFIDYYLVSLAFGVLFDALELAAPLAIAHPLQIGLLAYATAVQFHYSHYFICFAAQAMFDLWDLRMTVTKPLSIELPRSLVDVVIAWNIPMHHWLKRYVFQPCKRYFAGNIYATIFATYFISSYLHGFNFQIWTVLLTLGLLTQAEFKLRHRLAHIFSACIESRACVYYDFEDEDGQSRQKCSKPSHTNTGRSLGSLVPLANGAFTLLALVNLAFLGSTFDGKPDSSNLANVWFIWKGLYFYSHIIAVLMFALYKLI